MDQFDDAMIEQNMSRMEGARSNVDTLREEIASLVLPVKRGFNTEYLTEGQENTHWQYDEYAAQALEDGVSAARAFVIPQGQRTQVIELPDEDLMALPHVRKWMETLTLRLTNLRDDPQSGWVQCVNTGWTSLFAFGEQCTWVDIRYDAIGRPLGLSYQSEHVSEIYAERDAEGWPMRIYRKFTLTAEQAQRKFGKDTPPKVLEALKGDNPEKAKKFDFIHLIEPNKSRQSGRIGPAGMPFAGGYYSCADKKVFQKGGYWTMPRIDSTFDRGMNENYGRARAMTVLPAIRACQVIMQDRVIGVERSVRPTYLAPDDDLDESLVDLGPDSIIYGGLDERGNARLQQLFQQLDISSAENLHAQFMQRIDHAFYRDLLQIHRELKTHITALRTAEEISEKGILMEPLARQEKEWFSAMLPRELDLMAQLGLMDDMPVEISRYLTEGGQLDARYDNQLSRMRASTEVVAYLRTAEMVGSISQFDPQAAVYFRRQYPMERAIPRAGYINGLPASWEASEEELAAFDEQKSIEDQTEQLLRAAPVISDTLKNAQGAVPVNE